MGVLMTATTPGRFLFDSIVPQQFRAHLKPGTPIGSAEVGDILQKIAEQDPDKYRDVSFGLLRLGTKGSVETNTSFSLKDLLPPIDKSAIVQKVEAEEDKIFADKTLTPDERDKRLVALYGKYGQEMPGQVFDAAFAKGSRLAHMVASGARGNKGQLNSNIGADWLVVDSNSRPVPVPLKHNYAEGLDPAEYFAASYGTRRGLISTKFAVADAGFLSKQLTAAAQDLVVTDKDCETARGIPVEVDDKDNVGSILARSVAGVPAGTMITGKILNQLREAGAKSMVVRSPITCKAHGGGICSVCAGLRERNRLPAKMDNIGIAAASSLAEPLAQGMLSEKHTGGVASSTKNRVGGFQAINALAQVPEVFPDGAVVSEKDGQVTRIHPAPQGGHFITIDGEDHYVGPQQDVTVKVGDKLEAGDTLSTGVVNPADVVRHKGIGEGRLYFMNAMRRQFKDAGIKADRRNLEVLSRAIVNHVRIEDPDLSDRYLPDDVVEYEPFEGSYTPRQGTKKFEVNKSIGKYLEKPALHFSVGTRITPRVAKTLADFGETHLDVHDDPPGFQPEMVRLMESSSHRPDWMTRLGGSYISRNLVNSVHQGDASSKVHSTHPIPSLAEGVNFGRPPQGMVAY